MSEYRCHWCSRSFPTLAMRDKHMDLMHADQAPQPIASDGGNDPVNHPKHYVSHPSGIECIQITEHMGFNLGNATKYIWRADMKHNALEDLRKSLWYIQREISKREKENGGA